MKAYINEREKTSKAEVINKIKNWFNKSDEEKKTPIKYVGMN